MEEAIAYYQQALTISQETGDRYGEGHTLGNLGNAYARLGHLEEARQCAQAALAIAREIKVLYLEEEALRLLKQLE